MVDVLKINKNNKSVSSSFAFYRFFLSHIITKLQVFYIAHRLYGHPVYPRINGSHSHRERPSQFSCSTVVRNLLLRSTNLMLSAYSVLYYLSNVLMF